MRRVLVTGGTGFVGANLVRRLLRDGHEVHLLVRPERALWRLDGIRDAVRLHRAALEDRRGVARVVRHVRPEWIFHLAAHGAYSWETDVDRIVATNVVGTLNLLRAALATGFAAFVNAGSSSEYGVKRDAPDERAWVEPNSPYAVTKVAATHFCRLAARTEGAKIATLRLYAVYGPWEEPGRFVPTLVAHARAGRLPPLVDPRVARDFVWVDDVSEAFVRAAVARHAEPGPVWNVGSGRQTTIRDAVAIARRVFGVTARPAWGTMPNRRWDTSTWVADARAIRRALGWRPRVGFADGLRRLARWMDAAPAHAARYAPALTAPPTSPAPSRARAGAGARGRRAPSAPSSGRSGSGGRSS